MLRGRSCRRRIAGSTYVPRGEFAWPNAFGLFDTAGNVREWVVDSLAPQLSGGAE